MSQFYLRRRWGEKRVCSKWSPLSPQSLWDYSTPSMGDYCLIWRLVAFSVKVSATKVFPCGNLKLTPFPLEGGQVIWTNSPILQAAVPANGPRVRKDDTTVTLAALEVLVVLGSLFEEDSGQYRLGFWFIYFWPCCMAWGILVPGSGVEPVPPTLDAQCPHHWTTREILRLDFFTLIIFLSFSFP